MTTSTTTETATAKTVDDLSEGDVFSLDGGTTWHTCCIVLFGTVSVYTDDRRGPNVKNVVRINAEGDQPVLVR